MADVINGFTEDEKLKSGAIANTANPAVQGAVNGAQDMAATPATVQTVQNTALPTNTGNFYTDYRNMLTNIQRQKAPTATDQSDYLRQLYDSNMEANRAQLESNYQQNLSNLDSEASSLDKVYYEQRRQAQAQADKQRKAMGEFNNARGLNTGTESQAELAMQNQLSANINALRNSESEKRSEIERQRTILGQQYQAAIQEAKAKNDMQRAQALYDEAVRLDNSIRQAQQQDSDTALQIFAMLNNNAMDYASKAASNGDLSVYMNLLGGGGTSALNAAYSSNVGGYSGGRTGGGSSVGGRVIGGDYTAGATSSQSGAQIDGSNVLGSDAWYRRVKQEAAANGTDPASYIRANYKELGVPYSAISKYANDAEERLKLYSDSPYIIGSSNGYEQAASMTAGQSFTASDGSTWTKLNDGSIVVTDRDGMKRIASVTYDPKSAQQTQNYSTPVSTNSTSSQQTSGVYNIGSANGAAVANYITPGTSVTVGDGSTWTKNADGSITVVEKDGSIKNGVITYSG